MSKLLKCSSSSLKVSGELCRLCCNCCNDSCCCCCCKKAIPVQFWEGPTSDDKRVSIVKNDIYSAVDQSKRLRWCPYKRKATVAHTGIAIFLDENCITIDYTTTKGIGELWTQLSGAESVESAMEYWSYGNTSEDMEKGDIIQDVDLTTVVGRSQAMAVLAALGEKDTTPYHVTNYNCRHHVKQRVNAVAEVSKAMNIPFLVSPGRVIAEVEKFVFGTGEGAVAKQEGHDETRGSTELSDVTQNV